MPSRRRPNTERVADPADRSDPGGTCNACAQRPIPCQALREWFWGESNTRACYTPDARLARAYAIEPTGPLIHPNPSKRWHWVVSRWRLREVPRLDIRSPHTGLGIRDDPDEHDFGQGRGLEMLPLLVRVVQCVGPEWSRSSLMTGHATV